MLIDPQPFLTIERQRTRLDLGAAPPSGPIKEGYPCTRWHAYCWVHAHVRTHADSALLSFFFLATYTVCVIRSVFAHRRCTSIRGFLSGTGSLSPPPSLPPLPTRLSSCPSLTSICIGTYVPSSTYYIDIYRYTYTHTHTRARVCVYV